MKSRITITLFLLSAVSLTCCFVSGEKESFPVLKGPYLGQVPPGREAQLFAPDIVSTGIYTRDMAITPDGTEIYFCVSVGNYRYTTILFTREEDGVWSEPKVASFAANPDYMNFEPALSADGNKLLFLSNRPSKGEENGGNQDIWAVDRTENGWGEPYNLGPPVNTDASEYFPSLTGEGTLYFTRQSADSPEHHIYRSRLVEGKYSEPEKLPEQVNCGTNRFNAYVSRDESFVIVPAMGRKDSLGGVDYYITFRNEDDTWSGPVNLGSAINSPEGAEWSPYVSPDGKYFFFMASRRPSESEKPERLTFALLKEMHTKPENGLAGIYWIDAEVILELQPVDEKSGKYDE